MASIRQLRRRLRQWQNYWGRYETDHTLYWHEQLAVTRGEREARNRLTHALNRKISREIRREITTRDQAVPGPAAPPVPGGVGWPGDGRT